MSIVDLIALLDKKHQRLLACDCAEHVLHLFEQEYPEDRRPRRAIEVSRQFADSLSTQDQLKEAGEGARRAADDALTLSGIRISSNFACLAARAAHWAAWDGTGRKHLYGETALDTRWEDLTQFDAVIMAATNAASAFGTYVTVAQVNIEEAYDRQLEDILAVKNQVQVASSSEKEWQVKRAQWYLDEQGK